MKSLPSIFLILLFSVSCSPQIKQDKVLFGSDVLVSEKLDLIKNKKVGLVINQASVLSNGTSLLDTLESLRINITTIFSPEHGFYGNFSAGKEVGNENNKYGVQIYSLYGKTKKPTPEMLENVDVIVFDLQDIGARFYTYISTMFYVLQSAVENNKPVIILDRPNPLSGKKFYGPVLNKDLISFIGIAPIDMIHGITVGELANLFVNENYINTKSKPGFEIIKMKNWKREFFWDDFESQWIPTSPNIPDFETVLLYPATCLLEGTNISEGRGTKNPFKIIGAPFIDPKQLISELEKSGLAGCDLETIDFKPETIPGKADNPKYENQVSHGIQIHILDKNNFNQLEFGIKLLVTLHNLYPENFKFIPAQFDQLTGDKKMREMIEQNKSVENILNYINQQSKNFNSTREKYLLY
jgi:uncharacterized protein YbbC (DUF1343 family)